MRRSLAVAVVLAGCSAAPAPLPDPPVPEPAPVVRRPSPPATIGTLTPSEVIVAAGQARRDAAGYVAWSKSRADNIDRLTTLTTALNAAVARMRAGEVGGRYRPTDVIAARGALRDLRSFLANKGD